MTAPPRPFHTLAALDAYAEPIEADAAELAQVLLDAIGADIVAGAAKSYTDEIKDVDARDEWTAHSCAGRLGIPEGALEWGRIIWVRAFEQKLQALATVRERERIERNQHALEQYVRNRRSSQEIESDRS